MAPSDTGSCTQRMPCGIHALLNLLSLQHFPSPEALPELLPELSVFGNYKVVETLSQPNQKLPNLPIFLLLSGLGFLRLSMTSSFWDCMDSGRKSILPIFLTLTE